MNSAQSALSPSIPVAIEGKEQDRKNDHNRECPEHADRRNKTLSVLRYRIDHSRSKYVSQQNNSRISKPKILLVFLLFRWLAERTGPNSCIQTTAFLAFPTVVGQHQVKPKQCQKATSEKLKAVRHRPTPFSLPATFAMILPGTRAGSKPRSLCEAALERAGKTPVFGERQCFRPTARKRQRRSRVGPDASFDSRTTHL